MDDYDLFFMDSVGRWEQFGLMEYADFAEETTFVWQNEHGDGTLSGWWWYGHESERTVYGGVFGTVNAPGASGYSWAISFDELESYKNAVSRCEQLPEYATSGSAPFVSFMDYVCGRDDD